MGSLDTNPTTFSAFPNDKAAAFEPLNPDDVRTYLHKAVDFISDYYINIESMPVLPNVKPGYLQDELSASPPTYSAPFDVTMKELRTSVTHSTFFKACRLAGFDPANIRSIPTGPETDYGLDPAKLLDIMQADADAGLVPTYVCATVGTTSSNAVDPVGAVADVAAMFNAWVHVDAAYAGSACICPEFRHHLDGVEHVDSISMSPHKWLLTCLDCTCLYVRDAHRLSDSLETNPEYLKNDATDSGEVTDLKDMQVGVGRRFRGLKLWMVMRTYGTAKLQEHIRSDVAMAKMFEDFVRADDRFEVVVPRNFALVCFRIKATGAMTEEDADEANRVLMENLNKTGKAYLAHTVVGDRFVLRFAVGSSLQEERHVRSAWDLIKKTTSSIMD
ncbi:Aromatic-L-amino-acid decarboxylase [Triticum urartu]|uniref:Aromatic-L-amino-acid decarboxylase n=1 Tax=Triticum urartu TaxID=4572 RepID=M7ZTQ7_TRIUA|nr:Aromatic-L-amino-acid decarboxylase [Triticum urartu]